MSLDILKLNMEIRYKVLIIDDERSVCESLKRVLSSSFVKYSLDIYTAYNFSEGKLLFHQVEPDCIICDYLVRDEKSTYLNGIDFLSSLKLKDGDVVKILISAYADFAKLKDAVNNAGIFRFIPKPWEETELRSAIEHSIEYLELMRDNSNLLFQAEEKARQLMDFKSLLENKDKERDSTLKASEELIKRIRMEVEVMNKILTVIQMMKSPADVETMLCDIFKSSMDVSDVKIVIDYNNVNCPLSSSSMLCIPIRCSGAYWGYMRLEKRSSDFTSEEESFLNKISDVVAMTVEKLVRFSFLEKLKKQWEAMFDSIDDALILIDTNFNIVRANMAFQKLTGIKVQDVIGKRCFKMFQGGDSDICYGCNALQAFSTGTPVGSEVQLRSKCRYFTTWSYPMFYDDAQPRHVVQFYKDISEQKVYREKILQTEKLAEIGILAGSVAHEINNPIGGIMAFLQVMLREVDKDSDIYNDLKEMEIATQRCKMIVENLLHFSRRSRDEERKPVEMSKVLESLLPLLQLQVRHDNIEIEYQDDSKNLGVVAVFNELAQAILNLMQSSIDSIYSRRSMEKQYKGKLKLKTYVSGGRLFTEIDDDGVAVDVDSIVKIFHAFSTPGDKKEFRSLGLFVSNRIIKDYRGSIDIKTGNDSGNKFIVNLPVAKETI